MTWTSSSGSERRVGTLLREATATLRASGSESARLDAELLLAYVLRFDRSSLLAAPDTRVAADQAQTFDALVGRRSRGEPVAYIRGVKEFYGLAFAADPRALIPRPETELLVDLGLARLGRMITGRARPVDAGPLLAWDVGTGSGAICVALAVECRRRGHAAEVRFRATDPSASALRLATENAVAHGVADVIDFALADLTGSDGPRADLLVANLPYIPSAVVPTLPVAASYEPVEALDGGPDGLDLIRRLIVGLDRAVAPAGVALIEIGEGQADAVRDHAAIALPGWSFVVHDDLHGRPRVVELERATTETLLEIMSEQAAESDDQRHLIAVSHETDSRPAQLSFPAAA